MMGITNAFSTLSIDETSNNRPETSRGASRLPKNFRSLPNLAPVETRTGSPSCNRNHYSDIVCDDETNEQPIDFSQKYSETSTEDKTLEDCSFKIKTVKSYNNANFSRYAETDLDQPTDYSLRYAEDDSDLEDCSTKATKSEAAEFVPDTIKTYCTEDTPYETPFNFSTSTSMSDLRLDEKSKIIDESSPRVLDLDNNKEMLEISQDLPSTTKAVKSEFSSGIMSPEKPVNYCDEGTPGYFSRVASCGSLNTLPVCDHVKEEEVKEVEKSDEKEHRKVSKFPAETKAVKFEEVVNYAETPLMFSRSSSLASLDSIEQHSIHDDRSSVISDLSRLTSGLISPSDLPDSPTQTVPPSPKPRTPSADDKKTDQLLNDVPEPTIFEDSVKKFQIESTQGRFSTATSLSSLTIDEADSKNVTGPDAKNNDLSESSEDEDILAACINIGMQNNRYSQTKALTPPPSNDYNYTHMSSVTPPNTRHTPLNSPQNVRAEAEISPETVSDSGNVLPLPRTDITSDYIRSYCTEDTPALLSNAGSNSDLSVLSFTDLDGKDLNCSLDSNDVTVIQNRDVCSQSEVHGRPASSFGSQNVEIRLRSEKNEISQSQRSSFVSISEDSDEAELALLQECILAGMPKGNKSTNSSLEKSADLSKSEQVLLDQCILEGMKKHKTRVTPSKCANFQKYHNLEPIKLPTKEKTNDLTKTEEGLLKQCILSGIYDRGNNQNISPKQQFYRMVSKNVAKNLLAESDESSDDENSKYNNRPPLPTYNFSNRSKNVSVVSKTENDAIKSYYTEDTPAVLSHAGSDSDLSTLSLQDCESKILEDFLSDGDVSDDERLLEECVQFGMAKTSTNNGSDVARNNLQEVPSGSGTKENVDLNISVESNASDDNDNDNLSLSAVSSFSEDSYESEQALLQECILAGMPKTVKQVVLVSNTNQSEESNGLTDADEKLLQQCILEGMKKCRISPSQDDSSELTPTEQDLLRQCIISGMPKSKNINLKSSKSRDSAELTEAEKELLQQCILAGMPNKSNLSNKQLVHQVPGSSNNNGNKVARSGHNKKWLKRSRDSDRNSQGVEHNCCIHCPKNNPLRLITKQYTKTRIRSRGQDRGQVQIKDVNILYVSSQILALKKDFVDNSHGEWV